MFIIAEAGINHVGSYENASYMIDIAKNADCDAIKFQTFWGLDNLKQYELTPTDFRYLYRKCNSHEIDFMSTPHTLEAVDFLEGLVNKYKIASKFLTNEEFIKVVGRKNKPVLLATGSKTHRNGMATYKEINKALDWIGDVDVTLMHCVSKYPCYNSHLERIHKLEDRFGLPVGLSDHTKTIYVNYNVPVLEKHFFKWEQEESAPDKDVSLNPIELKYMVEYIRK